MEKQVIKELIEITGSTRIAFDDLKVNMSPHTYPDKIYQVWHDRDKVYALVNGDEIEWEKLSEPVRNTIIQRLRLLASKR